MADVGFFPETEPEFEVGEIGAVEKVLLFYRVMAWIVGLFLVVLVCVAMPMKYLGDNAGPVTVIGIAHGWLYPVLLVSAYMLWRRVQWPWQRLLVIALAGTVPFLSFVAERFATQDVRARVARVRAQAR